MIFKRLELNNFKSHQHNIINFNSGITLIIGENGAGKSTIFEAISFALYKKYTGDKIDDLIRTSAQTMSVSLTFISNGTEYKVTRNRSNNSKAKLEKKDKDTSQFIIIAESDKVVNQQIQEILDMDADLFLNAIYIRQGEIANLISKSPSERKQLIGKLLKLEELEKASKNILPFINNYKYEQAELKGKLSNEQFEQLLKQYAIEYKEARQLHDRMQQLKKDLQIQQKENQAKNNEMEKFKADYEKWNANLINETNNLKRLEDEKVESDGEVEGIGLVEERIEELRPFVERLEDYRNDDKYSHISDALKNLEDAKSSLNADIRVLENVAVERDKLQNAVLEDREALNDINVHYSLHIQSKKDLDSLEEQIAQELSSTSLALQENLEQLSKLKEQKLKLETENNSCADLLAQTIELDEQCPICKSHIDVAKKNDLIDNYNKIIQNNQESITELNYKIHDATDINDKLASQTENLKNIEKQLPQYRWLLENMATNLYSMQNMNARLLDLDSKKEMLKDIEQQIKIKQQKIGERDSQIKSLQKHNQEYNQLLGSIKNKNKILQHNKKLSQEILNKQKVIKDLTTNLKSSPYNKEEHTKLQQQQEKINNDIMETTVTLKESEIKLLTIEKQITNTALTTQQNEKNQQQYNTLETLTTTLEDIRNFYGKDGVQKTLRSLSRPIIQNYTKKFFKEFNFNYSNLTLDDEYNITLYGPEGQAKLDMISGGEKIAVALALRLGITEAISKANVETILLDEPTIHLDTQRIHELITLLQGLSTLPQMIIVTHDIELENAADNLIRVTKENGISNVQGD